MTAPSKKTDQSSNQKERLLCLAPSWGAIVLTLSSLCLLLLPGCYPSPVIFQPNPPQTPLLQDAGDAEFSVGYGTSNLTSSLSVALLDNIGIIAAGSYHPFNDSGSAAQHSGHWYAEGGVVLFDNELLDDLDLELIAGYGRGYGKGEGYDRSMVRYNWLTGDEAFPSVASADYQEMFAQLSVGMARWNEEEKSGLQLGGLLRLSHVSLTNYHWQGSLLDGRSFYQLQPLFYMKLTGNFFTFNWVIGGIRLFGQPEQTIDEISDVQMNIGAGLNIRKMIEAIGE